MTAVVATTNDLFYSPSVVQQRPFISKGFSVYENEENQEVQFKNTIDSENKMHLVNTVNKLTATVSNKKDTEIEASEFQNWVASHGGQQKLRALVAYTSQSSTIRRKRSTLSNVSYSSDSSSDDESDYIPISELQKELAARDAPPTPKPSAKSINRQALKNPKKPSWFTGLLQKKPGKPVTPPDSPSNKSTISAFFNTKKVASSFVEKKKIIPPPHQPLPTRYPFPIERAIQHISYMKLSNPKRPIRQQVLISNLLYQHTTTIQAQFNRCKKQSVVLNSMIYKNNNSNNQNCTYNIPPRKSSAYLIR